jgi:hypothetical protein
VGGVGGWGRSLTPHTPHTQKASYIRALRLTSVPFGAGGEFVTPNSSRAKPELSANGTVLPNPQFPIPNPQSKNIDKSLITFRRLIHIL